MKKTLFVLFTIALTVCSIAQMKNEQMGAQKITKAICVLHPTKGNTASGWVTFEVVENGVRVVAEISGLAPGKHGFHIHEFGDCSADNGTSAGGHYNPMGMQHSMPMSDKRHVGDLGNIEANKNGVAKLDYVDPMLKLGGAMSILGRGMIVHEKEDDLKTQPTGDAGSRLACGVIGVAKK